MKTIEMKVGNRSVAFTTKSVTIDGVEYLYGKMSGIKHSAEKHIYAFKYNGEYKYLPYDPKYAQVLGAIFKQVNALDKQRAAKAKAAEAAVQPNVEDIKATGVKSEEPKVEESKTEKPKAEEPKAEEVKAEEPEAEEVKAEEAKNEETKTEAETTKAEENTALTPAKDAKAPATDADKKSKLKKSIIIFVLILLIVGALTAGYFALFGLSSNPTAGPNTPESQQYDDIDQLIEDLD